MIKNILTLKGHEGFMKYLKNTSWLLGEKILRMFVGLLVGVWVARYLGPDKFGLLSYAQSFVGLFAVVATFGLDSIVVRELLNNQKKEGEIVGTAFVLKLFGSFVVFLLLFVAINFTSNDTYTNVLVFIIAGSTIFQSFNVVDFYFQSKVMSKFVVYANIISLLFSTVIKVVLILKNAPLVSFAFVILFDSFILACGFIYFFLKETNLKMYNLKFNKAIVNGLLKDSWPLIISGIVISIYMRIDQVMIKEMLYSGAVGQYAAAVRISEAWYFIPIVITSSLFPAIINAKQQSKELYNSRLQNLYNLMVLLAVVIALPMTFMSDWIVMLLYGEQYNEAGNVLMIHIWAGVFVFVGVASGKWLIAENLQIFYSIYTTIGAVLNIILNYILIGKFGIKGAAVATLISYFVSAYLCLVFHKKTRSNFINLSKSLLFIRIFNVKKTI